MTISSAAPKSAVEPVILPPVRNLDSYYYKARQRSVKRFLSLLVSMVITPLLAKGVDEPPVGPVGRDVEMSSINREVEAFSHAVVSGRAISAGLDRVDGRLVILVVVVSEGLLKQISIDPANNDGTRTTRVKAKTPSSEKQP